MQQLPYLDIHTHHPTDAADSISVKSLSQAELQSESSLGAYFTAGIHPWWLEDINDHEISTLQNAVLGFLEKGLLWGVGETGIDRLYPETLDRQLELFHWHLDLSEKYQLPLVIHNVRSGSDFLGILKARRPTQAWVFHDFRGNQELMQKLLDLHPLCYFSFGLSIDNSQNIRDLLPLVPLSQLFLETDAQKHLDIHDIYVRASDKLGIDLEFLKSQTWLNFKKITPSLSSKN